MGFKVVGRKNILVNKRMVETLCLDRTLAKGYRTKPKYVEALFQQTLPLAEKIALNK